MKSTIDRENQQRIKSKTATEQELVQVRQELIALQRRYQKMEQIFRLQEEIIASYEAAYGEAPGLIDEEGADPMKKSNTPGTSFFDSLEKRARNRFNEEQMTAITYNMEKNLRIIAGAGSGKTQTICAKAAYMIEQQQVPEEQIVMITFTRNAANELQKRVDNFSKRKTAVTIGTFHSIFTRFYSEALRKFPELTSTFRRPDFSKESGKRIGIILQQLIRKHRLFVLDRHGEKDLASRIDYWQNLDIPKAELIRAIEEKFDGLEKRKQGKPISQRMDELLEELEQQKQVEGLMDFNDILKQLKQVLRHPEIRSYFAQRYKYLFIDEFQDTNPLQWHIVQLLTKETDMKLIVVGDDDQSIYGFRGSEPKYIREFDQLYETETLFLLTNYRSRSRIVQSANRLIGYNRSERIPKAMVPGQREKGVAEIIRLATPEEEARWIVGQLNSFLEDKGKLKETILLYRSLSQTTALIQLLIDQKIPFVLETEDSYEGIFGLRPFRTFFDLFAKYVHSEEGTNEKILLYKELFSNYYIKAADSEQLLRQTYPSMQALTDAMVSSQHTLKGKEKEIEQFFIQLEKVKNDPKGHLVLLIQQFLQLPKIKKQIDGSEAEWLKSEIRKAGTFAGLEAMFTQTQSENQQLKLRTAAYKQGKLDALCLQSIHKSKGLSYRNVFLIGCLEGVLPYKGAVERTKADPTIVELEPMTTIEEERRLFYVAMTRARNRFYATYPEMKGTKKQTPSRFLKECHLPVKQVKRKN